MATKITYFDIGGNEVVYSASIFKRFVARVIDFTLALVVGRVLIALFLGFNYGVVAELGTGAESAMLFEFLPSQYETAWMVGLLLTLIGLVVFLWIIPLMNKKNVGQSIGKRAMNITPIYLTEGSERAAFAKRESLISLWYAIPIIMTMILGFDVNYMESAYNKYYIGLEEGHTLYGQLDKPTTTYGFIWSVWWVESGTEFANEAYALSTTQAITATIIIAIQQLWILFILVTWITMLVTSNKRGIHDFAADTGVVNLNSIESKEDADIKYRREKELQELKENKNQFNTNQQYPQQPQQPDSPVDINQNNQNNEGQ